MFLSCILRWIKLFGTIFRLARLPLSIVTNFIFQFQNDSRFERSTDPRSQLKFLEELDQLEKKRHSEAEREVLLRAAKVSALIKKKVPK